MTNRSIFYLTVLSFRNVHVFNAFKQAVIDEFVLSLIGLHGRNVSLSSMDLDFSESADESKVNADCH